MINKIYIIESLRPQDKLTGKELYDDIISRYIKFYESEIASKYSFVDGKNSFLEKINEIFDETTELDEIIIHIEAHGGNEEMQFGNYDLMKWTELESLLVKINLKCKNKLHLNLATCHGMHAAEKISLKSTAPYKSYISALNELSPNEILSDNSILYKEIIESKELYRSFIALCKQNPKTQFRIKDIETVINFILIHQINYFNQTRSLLKDFFDHYLNITIDEQKIQNLDDYDKITKYILELFFNRYLPK